jgi:hypothetical protein
VNAWWERVSTRDSWKKAYAPLPSAWKAVQEWIWVAIQL